jgi:hypothetical protein
MVFGCKFSRFLRSASQLGRNREDDGSIWILHIFLGALRVTFRWGFLQLIPRIDYAVFTKPTLRTPAAVRNFVQDCEVQSPTIRSRLAAADDFFKHAVAVRYSLFSAFGNRRFQFQERRQLFIRSHNETLSVAAMCVCNPDWSPVGINRWDAAPTPAGFAEILSDDFPASFHTTILSLLLITQSGACGVSGGNIMRWSYSHHSPHHQDQKRFADGSNQIDP